VYAMKVIKVETARKVRGIKELQPMAQLEMLHPDGKAMLNDEEIWIGLELFAEYIDADNKRKENERNERAEAKAREDALQRSSFENAEMIVDEKEQTLDSAGHVESCLGNLASCFRFAHLKMISRTKSAGHTFSAEGARFPVALRIAKRFLPDLMSEGVSESTFSIHSNFATDLRKCLKPQYISDMVFCNRNDHLLHTIVQPKIKQRYIKTYQRRGSEVPRTSHVQSPADRTGQIDVT